MIRNNVPNVVPNVHFPNVHFPNVHFPNVHFPNVHFRAHRKKAGGVSPARFGLSAIRCLS